MSELIARVRRRAWGHPTNGDERGFVLVWMAIVLIVLIGVAAFAVDLVNAYARGQRLQNALDAAALAGATELPTTDQAAKDRACELMANNDMPCTGGDVIINSYGRDANIANQMNVDGTIGVSTFFARIFGIDELRVHKHAEAQYDPPLRMGSPANNLGDVPECPNGAAAGSCTNVAGNGTQNLWAQIQGQGTNKLAGNAYTTTQCGGSPTDNCGGSNGDYDSTHPGEYFSIMNDGGGLNVHIYDAPYVDTGFQDAASQPGACAYNIKMPDGSPVPNYVFRGAYCTGDQDQSGAACPTENCDDTFATTYELLAPDSTQSPFDNNTVVCSKTVNGQPWLHDDIFDVTGERRLANDPDITDNFMKWMDMPCSPADPGEYILHVFADSPSATGTNNFSILATHGVANAGDIRVFSRERLPLFATKNPGPFGDVPATDFYLARVLPSTYSRTLRLNFFDIGDSAGTISQGTLKIVTKNATFPGGIKDCQFTDPPGPNGLTEPPWGDLIDSPSCSFTYTKSPGNSPWNGQWVTVDVPIPKNYTCPNPDDQKNCWIQLEINPNSGSFLSDATTWTATMLGSPVRLVG